MSGHSPARDTFDLVIVGGGLVGASLALALAPQHLRLALIEAAPWRSETQPSFDDRAIALSYGSRRIYEGLGIWPALASRVTPIRQIHVSDRGRFGFTRLDSRQEGIDALGYVITARELGAVLRAQLEPHIHAGRLQLIAPATVTALETPGEHAALHSHLHSDLHSYLHSYLHYSRNQQPHTCRATLVVAADGGQSTLRQQTAIEVTTQTYDQVAIVSNISPTRDHQGVAYERFTPEGPLALLPLAAQDGQPRCGLVWTRRPVDAQRLMQLSDTEFLAAAQDCFGQRLGPFRRLGQRHAYPLQLIRARQQTAPRLALIGNAAHTLHPIAGQGFNLGLRDVATLAQVIADAHRQAADIGATPTLAGYAQWRERDQRQVIGFTHFLAEGFSLTFPPLALARNLGLLALDFLPPLKHTLARHAMGLAGKLPRLARGLPL